MDGGKRKKKKEKETGPYYRVAAVAAVVDALGQWAFHILETFRGDFVPSLFLTSHQKFDRQKFFNFVCWT